MCILYVLYRPKKIFKAAIISGFGFRMTKRRGERNARNILVSVQDLAAILMENTVLKKVI